MYQEFKSPISVQIELTSGCNHKCIHCYNHWREPGESLGTISRDDLHKIIYNLKNSEVQNLTITGGEPMLFPELMFETIRLAQNANINCSINSNITYLNDNIASKLKEMGIWILTSFPSHDALTFDSIVRKSGAFKKTIHGIQTAQRNGIGLSANMVVMRQNKDHVYDTGRFLHGLGITNFSATKVHPSQGCSNFTDLQLSAQEIISFFDDLLRLREEFGIKIDTLTTYPLCLFINMERYGDLLLRRSCSGGKTACTIGPDGSVRPCGHSDEVYGNAITESLLDIWPRTYEWRNGSLIPEQCKKCKWLKQCGAACRMDSKFFHGSKDRPDPYMLGTEGVDIVIQNPKNLSDLDIDQQLEVSPHLRFRRESFGEISIAGNHMPILTNDSAALVKSLKNNSFSIRQLSDQYHLPLESTRMFFSELLHYEVVQKYIPQKGFD